MSLLIRIFTVCLVNLFCIPIFEIWNKQCGCPNIAVCPNIPDFTLLIDKISDTTCSLYCSNDSTMLNKGASRAKNSSEWSRDTMALLFMISHLREEKRELHAWVARTVVIPSSPANILKVGNTAFTVSALPPSSQAKGTNSTSFLTHKERSRVSTLGLRRCPPSVWDSVCISQLFEKAPLDNQPYLY